MVSYILQSNYLAFHHVFKCLDTLYCIIVHKQFLRWPSKAAFREGLTVWYLCPMAPVLNLSSLTTLSILSSPRPSNKIIYHQGNQIVCWFWPVICASTRATTTFLQTAGALIDDVAGFTAIDIHTMLIDLEICEIKRWSKTANNEKNYYPRTAKIANHYPRTAKITDRKLPSHPVASTCWLGWCLLSWLFLLYSIHAFLLYAFFNNEKKSLNSSLLKRNKTNLLL